MSPPHVRDCVKHVHIAERTARCRFPIGTHADGLSSGRHTGFAGSLHAMDSDVTPEADPLSVDPSEMSSSSPAPETSRSSGAPWLIAGGIGVAAILLFLAATQIYLVTAVSDTRDELASTREELDAARTEVALLEAQIVGANADDVSAATGDVATPNPSVTAPTAPAGVLPRYVPGQPDVAVGMKLETIAGENGYGDDMITIDPADGQKRIWMIWAHWCPHCQTELPALSATYDAYQEAYPDISFATISSSIDPSRGNPLEPYLEEQQFPFPVLVDPDSSVAARLGVNAFPFWVITDGDGTVLLRSAGYLDATQLDNLVESLDSYDA